MICRLCGRERGEPNVLGQYAGPNVCMWTEGAECESVRVAYRRALWMVAIGAAMDAESKQYADTVFGAGIAASLEYVSLDALRSLASLDDADAQRMIGGEP